MREGAAAGILAFGTTALCLVIGAFSLAIAARERRRGSPAWAWVVPGAPLSPRLVPPPGVVVGRVKRVLLRNAGERRGRFPGGVPLARAGGSS